MINSFQPEEDLEERDDDLADGDNDHFGVQDGDEQEEEEEGAKEDDTTSQATTQATTQDKDLLSD